MNSYRKSVASGSLIDQQNDFYDENEGDLDIYEENKDRDTNSTEGDEDSDGNPYEEDEDRDEEEEDRDEDGEDRNEEDEDQMEEDEDSDAEDEDSDADDEDSDEEDEDLDEDSDDQDEENEDQNEWEFGQNWNQKYIPDTSFSSNEVEGHTTIAFTDTIKPIGIFNKFFMKDIIDLMMKQTNIYGEKKYLSQNLTSSWQPLNQNIPYRSGC